MKKRAIGSFFLGVLAVTALLLASSHLESAYADTKVPKSSKHRVRQRVKHPARQFSRLVLRGPTPCGGDPEFIEARTYEEVRAAFAANPGAHVKLCNDIDAQGATLSPIGWEPGNRRAVDITGALDGLGHEIRNFVISPFDGEGQNSLTITGVTGLIPRLTGVDAAHPAVVRNLTLRNGQIPWTNRYDISFGLLAGAVTNGLIEDVKILESNVGEAYGSGLLAYSIYLGTLRRIELSGQVGHVRTQYADYLGGLAAFFEDGLIEDVKVNLIVDNSRRTENGRPAGGLIGQMYGGTIRKVRGNVTVQSASSGTGGLVGNVEHDAPVSFEDIRLRVNVGNPTETLESQQNQIAGGLIGSSYAESIHMRDIKIEGTVRGELAAGGLIGGFFSADQSHLERVAFIGTVRANNAGGILGWREYGPLSILNALARGEVTGTESAGGIVGRNLEDPNSIGFGTYRTTIENALFAGTVNATSSLETGGILGKDFAGGPVTSIVSSYYDGSFATGPLNGTGVESDTFTMQHDQSLYVNWDFNTVWKFNVGTYPILRSLLSVADINMDGQVTVQDLLSFIQAFFAADSAADIDGDGSVSIIDLFIYIEEFFSN